MDTITVQAFVSRNSRAIVSSIGCEINFATNTDCQQIVSAIFTHPYFWPVFCMGLEGVKLPERKSSSIRISSLPKVNRQSSPYNIQLDLDSPYL